MGGLWCSAGGEGEGMLGGEEDVGASSGRHEKGMSFALISAMAANENRIACRVLKNGRGNSGEIERLGLHVFQQYMPSDAISSSTT